MILDENSNGLAQFTRYIYYVFFPTIKLRYIDFVLQLLNVMINILIFQIQIFRDVNPDSLSRVIIFFWRDTASTQDSRNQKYIIE